MKGMRLIIALVLCLSSTSWAQSYPENLPMPVRVMLNRRFSGWKFSDVSPEVRQFFKDNLREASPVVISGDFDGNRGLDYAVLVQWASRYYLVIFLRRSADYKMYVIKDPAGDYLSLARKGTRGYNYEVQKEITYANDSIITGFFEKGGSSYVFKNGRFLSFVSSD
jgi:hypothetical protein